MYRRKGLNKPIQKRIRAQFRVKGIKMKTSIIIPARYASTRLPGKPLIKIGGKSIIQHVYERACLSKSADEAIVATDDERIFDEVKSFGGLVKMTSSEHKCGSDRIAEIVKSDPSITIAVNVQGDEPMIDPQSIDKAIEALKNTDADISTLIRVIDEEEEISNPNVVKAVVSKSGMAMYFSRSRIPYIRNPGKSPVYAHIGLYAYKSSSLLKMTQLSQTPLEISESLEQLRALENEMRIATVVVDYSPVGIDTVEDVEKFQKIIEKK